MTVLSLKTYKEFMNEYTTSCKKNHQVVSVAHMTRSFTKNIQYKAMVAILGTYILVLHRSHKVDFHYRNHLDLETKNFEYQK